MVLSATWQAILDRLAAFERHAAGAPQKVDALLEDLGLREGGRTSDLGSRLYMAAFVLMDGDQEAAAVAEVLKRQPVVNGFCEALWAVREVPVEGAANLIRRLSPATEAEARRLLELMNRGRLISYNRNSPRLRVLYNPSPVEVEDEQQAAERDKAHLLAPDTRYSNVLALREMLRAARVWIRWYEQHMPAKVMEVLHRELQSGTVSNIRILSGPANVTKDAQVEFRLFREEMAKKRGITVEWRVLSKEEAANHHDRFFLSEGLARNLPPLNSILKGTTGEILPSQIGPADFDQLWAKGADIDAVKPAATT